MTTRADYVEEVRIRALRLMQDRRWQTISLAAGVHHPDGAPYSVRAVRDFLAGAPDFQTVHLAYAVARAHPEIADGLACPYCGRSPIT